MDFLGLTPSLARGWPGPPRATDHWPEGPRDSPQGTKLLPHLIKLVSCSGGCRQTRGPLLTNNQVNKFQKDKADLLSARHCIGSAKTTPAFGKEALASKAESAAN